MVTMLAASLSFANDGSFLIIKKDAKTTALKLENVKQGNLLSIKDAKGVVLFEEAIKKNGIYNKGFDLTELPNGKYLFELEKDFEIKTMPFEVAENKIAFIEEEETIVFKPSVRVDKNLILISKLNLDKKPLKIDLYFEDKSLNSYDLLLSETIENTQKIERAYKFSTAKKGNYKLVFKSEGQEFIKYINN